MHSTLEGARRFQDLLTLHEHDAPYVYSGIFDDTGFRARRLSKKKFKLLRRIDDALRPMLHEGERVLFLTFGTAVSFWESYFLGWAMYIINRRAIVLTGERVLLLQVDSRDRPGEFRSQLDYRAIARVKGSVVGNTVVKVKSGKSHVFTRLPKADRKALQKVTERLRSEHGGLASGASGIEELCPYCFEPVAGRPPQCPGCRGAFKSASKAGLLSLIFPGLGDIYLGHGTFAMMEIIFGAIIWISWIGAVLTDPNLSASGVLVIAAFVVFFVHGGDAVATWYLGRRGLYPARASTPASQPAMSP
jgi:hypothetical protein